MTSLSDNLSEAEIVALNYLKANGGGVLISDIPDKNEKDHMGFLTPGMRVYKSLEKKGLVIFTEEEPVEMENFYGETFEFTFTPMIQLTDY